MKNDSYMWSHGNGTGKADGTSCGGVGTTEDLVNQSPKTVFTSMMASYMGDWDIQNDVMRAALASNGWILSCFWSTLLQYTPFHFMGMGETIGYCLRTIQNNINTYEQHDWVHVWINRSISLNLLGDPTLRMHIVCPVNTLQSGITANKTIMLAWKPADDNIIGYNIYKLDTLTDNYNKINLSPVTDTYFEDTMPVSGKNYYMVKTLKLSRVACGSYYNLSQGIFDTINFVQQEPVAVSGITLSLNSGNILPLKIYDPFMIDAVISPANATNKLLKWSVENLEGEGKFDKYGSVFTEKGGKIAIIAEALDGSNSHGRLEVNVDSIPDAAGVIAGDETVCRDYHEKLYTVPAIRGASSYIWTLPTGESDTILLNEIDYNLNKNASSGYIKVKGHNAYADGYESKLYITLNEMPPRPVITLSGNVLHSNAKSGNQWYMGYNTLIEGATDSIYIPVDTGSYFVRVTMNGCTSGNSNSLQYTPTFINGTVLTNETVIYPNPSAGQFTISFGTDPVKQATVKVFSLQGNLIYSEIFQNTTKADIDLTAFPKGMYIVRIITDENNYNGKVSLE